MIKLGMCVIGEGGYEGGLRSVWGFYVVTECYFHSSLLKNVLCFFDDAIYSFHFYSF